MSDDSRTRLAVLGSPISHSLSPRIHKAAYEVLGLDWSYESVDVTEESLAGFAKELDSGWRGLSLTMPLKRGILPLLDSRDSVVDTVGAANTVLVGENGELYGFNTDVYGVAQSFRDVGVYSLDTVHVLGAGATAASVIAGVAGLGANRVLVSARTPAKAAGLVALGVDLGVEVMVDGWGVVPRSMEVPTAVVSTLPGGVTVPDVTFEAKSTSVLLDVAYSPWPSALATSWATVGSTVISGLDLLVNQAVGQIRIFLTGNPSEQLPDEPAVVRAMREALHSR